MKDIKGYEGLYAVTEDGQIWSYRRKKFLKLDGKVGDYQSIGLSKDGKVKGYAVHRLVAQAYIPNPDNLPMVNHKDEVKSNNCVDNLEWCTREYNCNYGTAVQRRLANWNYHPSPETIEKIKAGNRGKKLTEEAKRKLSEGRKGKPLSEYHKQRIKEGIARRKETK